MAHDYEWLTFLHAEPIIIEKLSSFEGWKQLSKSKAVCDTHRAAEMAETYGFCDENDDVRLSREWFVTLEKMFKHLVQMRAHGNNPHELPSDLMLRLSKTFGYLAVGQMPQPIERALTRGRSMPGPDERGDIAWAVAYHRAAGNGLVHQGARIQVDDRTPTKTLAGWFGTSARTIQRWVGEAGDDLDLGFGTLNAEVLAHRSQSAGKRYKAAGRSQTAIAGRNSKMRRQ